MCVYAYVQKYLCMSVCVVGVYVGISLCVYAFMCIVMYVDMYIYYMYAVSIRICIIGYISTQAL